MGQAGVLKGRRAQPPDGSGNGDVRQADRALKATGPDLVDRFPVHRRGDAIRSLAACGIGQQDIVVVILRRILHKRRPEQHAVLCEVIGIVGIDLDLHQAGAALEDVADDLFHAGRDLHVGQFRAVLKRTEADEKVISCFARVGESNFLQVFTSLKSIVTNVHHAAGNGDTGYLFVSLKGLIADLGNGVGDHDVAACAVIAQQDAVLNVRADQLVFVGVNSPRRRVHQQQGKQGQHHCEQRQQVSFLCGTYHIEYLA